MVSKFAKSPCPSRKKLKKLYDGGLTQKEIGLIYGVDYRTVLNWMKRLNIKSRGILHIVKLGGDNPQWKGDNATYAAMHYRVVRKFGRANKCTVCGDNSKLRYDWACIGDYKNVNDYRMMCRSCHFKMDEIHISKKIGRNRRKEFDERL